MLIRKYENDDISQMISLWNEVVEDGIAFPQEELFTEETGAEFFASQSYCGVAVDGSGEVVGLYILHPNNVGRCGHICNASYAVSSKCRGQHIGEKLVLDCIARAKEIEAYCAERIGGLALPRFVADLPGARRKLPLDLL